MSHEIKYHQNSNLIDYECWRDDNGSKHREDGPAYIGYHYSNIHIEMWYKHGLEHRLDGPAEVQYYEYGGVDVEIWKRYGKWSRLDGPSYISYDHEGNKVMECWFYNGRYHRVGGPAITKYPTPNDNVAHEWCLCNEEYPESKYNEIISLEKSIRTRNHAIMNMKHPSEFIRIKCQEILNGI